MPTVHQKHAASARWVALTDTVKVGARCRSVRIARFSLQAGIGRFAESKASPVAATKACTLVSASLPKHGQGLAGFPALQIFRDTVALTPKRCAMIGAYEGWAKEPSFVNADLRLRSTYSRRRTNARQASSDDNGKCKPRYDNLLMWSQYAESRSAVVLEFKTELLARPRLRPARSRGGMVGLGAASVG
jgi:hypothetical protein